MYSSTVFPRNMSHSLNKFINLRISADELDPSEIVLSLPDGWREKFKSIIFDFYDVLKSPLIAVDIRDGVLYLTKSDDSLHITIANYVIRSVAQESARTCMVCGKYARRRKEQAHKPALCREHYLEYINALED
jgi:hypothetical protein